MAFGLIIFMIWSGPLGCANSVLIYHSLEKIAEANRNRVILEAEAEAESIKIKGEAEAFSMAAKGKAEAEQLTMKADAYKFYKDAAGKIKYFARIFLFCILNILNG